VIKILKPNIIYKKFDANLFRNQMKNNSCIENYKLTNKGLTALTKTLSIKGKRIGKFEIKIDFYGKTSINKLYQFHMSQNKLYRWDNGDRFYFQPVSV
jgi:hypothetical protein